MQRIPVSAWWLSMVLAAAPVGAATAGPPKTPPDGLQYQRVSFSLALSQTNFDTQLRSDSSPGVRGTLVSGEDDLALPKDKLTGLADLTVRIWDRHRFRFGTDFLSLNRNGETALSRPILYGGSVYRLGDTTRTTLDLRRYTATYLYSPIRNEKFELAAGIGLALFDFASALEVPARGLDEADDGMAPVPHLAVEGLWRFSRHWYVEGRARYLQASVSKANASEQAFSAAVVWAWQPGMALSLGYQSQEVEAESRFSGAPGLFRLKTSGPQLAVRVGF